MGRLKGLFCTFFQRIAIPEGRLTAESSTRKRQAFGFQQGRSGAIGLRGAAMRFRITNTAFFAPPTVETAEELSVRVGRSADWIRSRTGVQRRHVSEEPMDVMGARVGLSAIGDGAKPDLVINASLTPRQLIPDSSVFVLREMGLEGIPAFSVHATCLSYLVAMHVAGNFIESGAYSRILIVSAEQGSVCRDFDEPESAVLIGDGSAATVIERTPDGEASRLLGYKMTTWPDGAELAELRGCGTFRHPNHDHTVASDNLFHMSGPAIYRKAYRRVDVLVESLLEETGLTLDDIDWVIPHQASGPALSALQRMGFDESRVVNIVAEYGNCIAASIPMALAYADAQGSLQRGQVLLVLGTGAGLSVAGALLVW